jgi:dihydrofolate synthase/folylpolyglutamate synthase
MNYPETLQFLYAQLPVFEHVGSNAYKPGLQNIEALDQYFDHPHRLFRTIHVAGTNGKGSVSHTLAAMLQAEGLRVGLFTSPHLLDFSERIRVNGQPISEEYVVEWTARHYEHLPDVHPSFFELATMMAFCYFADQKVDVAVIEVGLGGRLDSTNIIRPELCVITNISLDHTQFLGDTLPQIAAEKAGIMKPGVPCVVGEAPDPAVREVFVRHAAEVGAPLLLAEEAPEVLSATVDYISEGSKYQPCRQVFRYETRTYGTLTGELVGQCQPHNANTILCAVGCLPAALKPGLESIRKGLSEVTKMTGLMGRWQQLRTEPETYCDTGHNEGCFRYISEQLKRLQREDARRLYIVFGMMRDKDIDAVLRLLPTEATYYVTAAATQRSMPADEMAEHLRSYGLMGQVYDHVADALEAATRDALESDEATPDEESFVFIGGSNFVVAEAMQALKKQ